MHTLVEANSHGINPLPFRKALIAWGKKHFRPFSWRLTEDPYRILMAELMLHRTQAKQVAPVYDRFIANYPDLLSLVQADRKRIYNSLSSLGLYWRIELIFQMTAQLISRFNGQIPQGKADLLSLPGVSEYISNAVRCFSWNIPEPLIDTNTVRVVGRLFNLKIRESSRRNRLFRELITSLLDRENPRAFNYALFDLAEQICTAKKPPNHKECPLLYWCNYGSLSLSHNSC